MTIDSLRADLPEAAHQAVFTTGGPPTLRQALSDIGRALSRWELWLSMAWQDIKQRYRGSMLGPFWVTINMGVMVLSLGVIYGQLFGASQNEYLPYLTLGFLSWLWMANAATEGTQVFVASQRYIKQVRLPVTLFIFRLLARNLIVLAHNFVVYLVLIPVLHLDPGWLCLLAIPGLMLGVVALFWISLLFAMLGARFRDFPQIITSLIQVVFYVTPIIWQPGQLAGRRLLVVAFNPVYYFIEIVRAPLLGHAPPIGYWKVAVLICAVLTAIVFPLFLRFRSRLAYWV